VQPQADLRAVFPAAPPHPLGRLGAKVAQYTVAWSTLLFDLENRHDCYGMSSNIPAPVSRTLRDRRAASTIPRLTDSGCANIPLAYVIPLGTGQRSDPEANRLVDWLLTNGIQVDEMKAGYDVRRHDIREGFLRRVDDPRRTAVWQTQRSASARMFRTDWAALRSARSLESRLPVGR